MNTTSEPTLIPPCSRCAATPVVRNGVNSVGTLRPRCARVVRKTLSFSRKMENHVGAL